MSKNPEQITPATAMMLAANYVEHEAQFDFMSRQVPSTCTDEGCALGWISYVSGVKPAKREINPNTFNPVARWLGYEEEYAFYRAMDHIVSGWRNCAPLAAKGLRKLAEKRMEEAKLQKETS